METKLLKTINSYFHCRHNLHWVRLTQAVAEAGVIGCVLRKAEERGEG
jgi:hypothetical protein